MNYMKINSSFDVQDFKFKTDNSKKELDDFKKIFDDALEKKDEKKLEKVAIDFEEMFINMMFKSMSKTILNSDIIQKSFERKMFEDMMYEDFSKSLAKRQSLGIAKMVIEQYS